MLGSFEFLAAVVDPLRTVCNFQAGCMVVDPTESLVGSLMSASALSSNAGINAT